MKFLEFHFRITKHHENLIIPQQNQKKNETPRIPCRNHENHENLIIRHQNQENHEIPKVPC